MPIPGLTDAYQFVDWLKERKYRIENGEEVTLLGGIGGTLHVHISPPCELDSRPGFVRLNKEQCGEIDEKVAARKAREAGC